MAEVKTFVVAFVVAVGGKAFIGDEVVQLALEVDFAQGLGIFFFVPVCQKFFYVVFVPTNFTKIVCEDEDAAFFSIFNSCEKPFYAGGKEFFGYGTLDDEFVVGWGFFE